MENHRHLNEVEAQLEEVDERYITLESDFGDLMDAYRNAEFEIKQLRGDLRQAREELDRKNNIASMKRVNEKENDPPAQGFKT